MTGTGGTVAPYRLSYASGAPAPDAVAAARCDWRAVGARLTIRWRNRPGAAIRAQRRAQYAAYLAARGPVD